MLILLEDYTINDPVLSCSCIVDANGNAYLDFGSRRVRVKNLAAPRHVSDRLAEAIVHRSAAFPKNDSIARSVLSNRPRAFSSGGGRACACGWRPLLRHVLGFHKRLLNCLSRRQGRHCCQANG